MDEWQNSEGDFHPALKLILPHPDKACTSYGMKEKVLAKTYVEVLGLAVTSPDAESLMNWRNPGKSGKTTAGDFPGVLYQIIVGRSNMLGKSTGSVADVNEQLDLLDGAQGKEDRRDIKKATNYTEDYGSTDKDGALALYIIDMFEKNVKTVILDGELLAYNTETSIYEPFGSLKSASNEVRKLGINAKLRVCFIAFDVVYLNGKSLLDQPLKNRYKVLLKVFKEKKTYFELNPHQEGRTIQDLTAALDKRMEHMEEGLCVKNPMSTYLPSGKPQTDWLKVKPDYMSGYGDDVDILLVGGFYAMPFLCKFGSGYKMDEIKGISRQAEGQWRPYDPKKLPPWFLHPRNSKEKPDMILSSPEHAIVVQLKGFEITMSEIYGCGYTMRLPRFVKIRDDKTPETALSASGLQSYLQKGSGRMQTRQLLDPSVEAGVKPKTASHRVPIVSAVKLASQHLGIDRTQVLKTDDMFSGVEFCVLPGAGVTSEAAARMPLRTSALQASCADKRAIETSLLQHGANVVQNPTDATKMLIADQHTLEVSNLKQAGTYNMVQSRYILECLAAKEVVPFSLRHMIFATSETLERFKENVNRWGDSYVEDLRVSTMKELFDLMEDSLFKPRKRKAALGASEAEGNKRDRNKTILEIDEKYFPWPHTKLRARGAVAVEAIDSLTTHIVVDQKASTEAFETRTRVLLRLLSTLPDRMVQRQHLLGQAWVDECIRVGRMVDEREFEVGVVPGRDVVIGELGKAPSFVDVPSFSATLNDSSTGSEAQDHRLFHMSQQQDNPDRLVAAYLKGRGYKQTETAFRTEAEVPHAATSTYGGRAGGEASVPDFILFYNENESSNPNAYQRSYERLRKWVDDSIDVYKFELRRILFPVFVHAYLDLVERGLRDSAKAFLDNLKGDHIEFHGPEIQRLSAILEPRHVVENELAQNWRSNRFNVEMSRYSFELLLSYLQDNKFMLILCIVNEHVSIHIGNTRPEAATLEDAMEADEIAGVSALSRESPKQMDDVNKTKLLLGQLPPDLPFLADVERVIKHEDANDATQLLEELHNIKTEISPDAPPITYPPKRLIDIPTAIAELREARNKVQVSPAYPVSICCYTFHNVYGSLQSLTVSPDTSVIAGGFSDSFIRLWDIDSTTRDPKKASKTEPALAADFGGAGRRLVGHAGPVYATSFSADQRYLISCSEDQTARLWSLDTYTNLVAYKGHNYPIWDVAFSPRGWYFATASHDKTARLWSCDHIYPLRIFVGHLSDVDAVKFHPNGGYVLTGSTDRTSRLWDVQRGDSVRVFKGHTGSVQTLAFSPDGRTMASAGEDHSVMLWDIGSGKRIKKLVGHTGMVYSLEFSEDGSVLASGSGDNSVRVWDVKKAETKEIAIRKDGFARPAQIDRQSQSLLGDFPTKRTPIFDLRFTRTNILMAVGPFTVD
ncbi:DNA ligase (ATP) [Thoreauomyces humboldtii]|nr:DNA ligase (ATP) [Thoreauomyces humboldtii]